MQVEVDVKCMQTNFGGRDLIGFGVMAPFACLRKRPKFPFRPWGVEKSNRIESAQKIHASRG